MNHDSQPQLNHLRRSYRISSRVTLHQQVVQQLDSSESPDTHSQIGYIEHLMLEAHEARQIFIQLNSGKGRRTETRIRQIEEAQRQVQEREEAATRYEEELLSIAKEQDPLIYQDIIRLRNSLFSAKQSEDQLKSVSGRRSAARQQ